MRTAILIHGQFLLPEVWPKVMWGEPTEDRWGVIPTALRLAIEEGASLIYWCTGIPAKGGRAMSPHAFEYAQARVHELEDWGSALGIEPVVDTEVQNTQEEVARAFEKFLERGIERVVMVTAPPHISRALNLALQLQEKDVRFEHIRVLATASKVSFPGTSASTTVIVEKSHRSDLPGWDVPLYMKAILGIMKQGPEKFEKFLAELAKLLKKYGVAV